MKPPTPEQCDTASKALRRAASVERADGDSKRAELLDEAAAIMEAKALVGALAAMPPEQVARLAKLVDRRRGLRP